MFTLARSAQKVAARNITKRCTSSFTQAQTKSKSQSRGLFTAVTACAVGAAVAYHQYTNTAPLSAEPSIPSPKPSTQPNLVKTHNDALNFDHIEFEDFAIFSGRANPALAAEIAEKLGVKLGEISIKGYADGEIGIQVHENVRGKDVYLIQPTCPPGVNDHLVELLLMVSTMRRASARRITAVIPYYGYARQDRKMASRVPISAADVARLLQSMGVDRVVAVDLHCGQIQGFFGPRTPCDNLEAHVVALPFFKDLGLSPETTKVVSPDAGGVYRAKRFRDGLKEQGVDAGLAMIVKQRLKANQIGRMDLVGDVDGCDVIMVDDMIDTAGTLTEAAKELRQMGAKRIFAFATHGVFSGPAYDRIANSVLEQVIVCNTVPLREGVNTEKIVQISIAELLSAAIARIHMKKSVSALFQQNEAAAKAASAIKE